MLTRFIDKYGMAEEEAARAEIEAQKKGAKAPTSQARNRAMVAWGVYPEYVRPEFLAGGLQLFPQGDYNAMLQKAVARGDINEQQGRVAANAYKKWTRTLWGATVDNTRLNREMKWIRGRQMADQSLIKANEANESAKLQKELSATIKDRQDLYNYTREQYRKDYDGMLQKQSDAIDELSQMRIDPGRWFQSRDTGQKVMAIISMGLGAMGASFSKGPNWAHGMIQSHINRDIDAQKQSLSNVRSSIRSRQNLLGFFDRRLGNLDQATKMSRLFLNDYYTAKLKVLGANAVNELQRRNYSALMEAMAKDREVLGAELRRAAAITAAKRAAAAAAARAKRAKVKAPILTPARAEKLIPIGDKGKALLVDAPAEAVERLRKMQRGLASFEKSNNELRQILQKYKSAGARAVMTPADKARAQWLAGQMLMQAAEARGKNFTKMEFQMVENAGGIGYKGRTDQYLKDILGISRGGKDGRLVLPTDILIQRAAHDLDTAMAGYNVTVGYRQSDTETMQTGTFKESDTPVTRFVAESQGSQTPTQNMYRIYSAPGGTLYGDSPKGRIKDMSGSSTSSMIGDNLASLFGQNLLVAASAAGGAGTIPAGELIRRALLDEEASDGGLDDRYQSFKTDNKALFTEIPTGPAEGGQQ